MARNRLIGRLHTVFVIAALVLMALPGLSFAATQITDYGTLSSPGKTDATISTSITYTYTKCGSGGQTGTNNGEFTVQYKTTAQTWAQASSLTTQTNPGSPYNDTITGLSSSTTYDVRIMIYDPEGTGASCTSPPTTGYSNEIQVTTNAPAVNGTTTGTLSTTGQTTTSVSLEATYTGDDNQNNSVSFQWSLAGQGSWNAISGPSVNRGTRTWSATASTLSPGTSYDFRVTFTDSGDGVSGTNPLTLNGVSTLGICKSTLDQCTDCHTMPPVDWDGVSAKEGTTGHRGDHDKPAHTGTGLRADCARCHYEYSGMINVTSTARWSFGHADFAMDIFTSNHVSNGVYASPYDKGIKGGYYKGIYTTILDDNTPSANNVCTATYCHGAGDSPVWGTGSAACGSCHSIPPSAGKHSTHSNGYVGYKNNSNGTAYDFGCYKCHNPAVHASGPVSGNQAAPVAFDNLSAPLNPSGSYTAGGSVAGTDGTFNWTNGTCNTTYCHSNGAGSNVTNPTWNGTLPANCTGCHSNNASSGSPMSSGRHTAHVNNADANLARFACIKCHNATVSSDTVIGNEANHVNGTPTVSFDSTNPSGNWSDPNCTNLYCHSSGQATPTYRTGLDWTTGTLGCNGCHGADNYYTDYNGSPDYQNVSSSTRNSFNGHYVSAHVSAATDCIKCHNATVDSSGAIKTSSSHLDGSRNVSFLSGGSYSDKRCSNTSCHGTTTLRWGGSAACSDCHYNTGAIGNEKDDYTYGNNTTAQINETEWLNQGHGKTSGTYSWTGNSAANLVCDDCHNSGSSHGSSTNPFRLISSSTIKPSSPDTLCTTTCHTSSTVIQHSEANVDANYPTGNATWSFTPKCVDCHDPHGDVAGGVTPAEYNGAMIQRQVAAAGSSTYGVPTLTGYGLVNMDFPDDDPNTSSDFNYASFQQNDFSGLCQVCHDDTNVVNYSRSLNNTSHYSTGGKCTGCHTHNKGFAPAGGSCTGCHGTGGSGVGGANNRRDIQGDFTMTSHHINATWANIDPISCAACHAEGNYSDGSVNSTYHQNSQVDLKQWTASVGGSFNVLTNVTNAQITTHCLSCHNATNASATPFSSSGDTGGNPGDYDGSYGSIAARYSDTGTTTSHPYSASTYNVVPSLTKAYSPHGNPSNNKMKNVASGAWADDTGQSPVNCIDCHNSHGSNALTDDGTYFNGITYSSAVGAYKGGLLKTTSTYDPDETAAYSAGSDLCFDCHINPGHAGADSTAPKTASNFGVAASRDVHEYNDAGRWGTTETWSGNFSYKNGDNTGKMRGGHFGKSSNLVNAPTNLINGSCMTCHDPHGTPTGGYMGTGTNRARMAPALKGTWMSSPYKEDRVPSTTATDTNSFGATIQSKGSGMDARIAPTFSINNPADLGAGFGTGLASLGTYGVGGSGAGGYFIDDNTFGNSSIDSTAANPWGSGTITATYISEGVNDFGGLCLTTNCHSASNLQNISYSNGTDTIKVHNTVKGWYSAGNAADLFKDYHTSQHSMAFKNSGTATTSNRCTSALWTIPAGYRWSVNPGTQKGVGQASGSWGDILSQLDQPPAGSGGQQTDGTKQASFHQFPCAKCHAPHATKLPRLMKTNCLDVGTNTVAEGGSPRHNASYTFSGCADGATANYKPMICHGGGPEVTTNNGNWNGAANTTGGGGWNVKTGW